MRINQEWTNKTIEALNSKQFEAIDTDELINNLHALDMLRQRNVQEAIGTISHLLIWRCGRKNQSDDLLQEVCREGFRVQMFCVIDPVFKQYLEHSLPELYQQAKCNAAMALQRPIDSFPVNCPFSLSDILLPDQQNRVSPHPQPLAGWGGRARR